MVAKTIERQTIIRINSCMDCRVQEQKNQITKLFMKFDTFAVSSESENRSFILAYNVNCI